VNLFAALLMIAAIACEVFSYWGLNTVSGRSVFDEMAGMIPLTAAPVGFCFAAGAVVVWWRNRRAKKDLSR